MSDQIPLREAVARLVDPSSWSVMDHYLLQAQRQCRGKDASYDLDAFKHKKSLAKADEIMALIAERQQQESVL